MRTEMSWLLSFSTVPVLLAASALAGSTPEVCQVAVLRNGFSIQYARREVDGTATRLYLCAGAGAGYVEIPSDQIERFEQPPAVPPLAAATPAGAPTAAVGGPLPDRAAIKNMIASSASRHRIDADFLSSVVKAESGFNPSAISPKGAEGLMQLMPETAAQLGVENALDPAANVEGGTRYLRELLDRYGWDAVKALAAYNAGPQRVEQYGGIPPYPETRAYVARIIDDYNRQKLRQQADSAAPSGN